MFPDLEHKNSLALSHAVLYFIRRYVLVFSIVLLADHYVFQIFAHIIMSVVHTGFVWRVGPFENWIRNGQEILNEFAIVLCSYHLLLFTPPSFQDDFGNELIDSDSPWTPKNIESDSKLRNYMGYQLISIGAVTIFLNLMIVAYVIIKSAILKYKIRKANLWKKDELKRKEEAEKANKLKADEDKNIAEAN